MSAIPKRITEADRAEIFGDGADQDPPAAAGEVAPGATQDNLTPQLGGEGGEVEAGRGLLCNPRLM
jgi:hypothetical protein